jgi:hypothetical protein
VKAKVYSCTESHIIRVILRAQNISRQALVTVYESVCECESKNILNVCRIWLKFRGGKTLWNSPETKKKPQNISPGDIIEIANDFYMVSQVGARRLEVVD